MERAAGNAAHSSAYDRIIQEIDPVEVPARYIDCILILYKDGTKALVGGDQIRQPLALSNETVQLFANDDARPIHEIKLFLKIDLIETDANRLVDQLLNNYC